MITVEQSFRRNFTVACVAHVALIGGLVLTNQFWNGPSHAPATAVELVVPADILGDLPEGPGHGRGPAAPPSPEPPGPSAPAYTPEEQPVPAPTPKAAPAPAPAPEPGEVLVPSKTVKETKAVKKPVVAAPKTTKPVTVVAKPATATAKPTGAKESTGPSAAEIRAKFAKALASGGGGGGAGSGSAGGTVSGDNKPAGGGDGKKRYGRPGSPDGAENGVAGGMGKGTPFWWYYQHVHDRMYEAWERPAEAAHWDRKLMSTVVIRVARDGKILEVKLQDSSGNKLMDETAVTAARKVPRLDPLPDGMKGDTVDISVNFSLEG